MCWYEQVMGCTRSRYWRCVWAGDEQVMGCTRSRWSLRCACGVQEVPPYNYHGSLDDSLQNLRKVVPVAPRRDYVKYMDNIGKLLRYEARLVTTAACFFTAAHRLIS